MEIRLQPGQGNNAPRVALFALLAALSILLIGVYWFHLPDPLVVRKYAEVKIPPGKRPIGYFTYRTEDPNETSRTVKPAPPKPPVPAQNVASIPRPAPTPKPVSKTLIEAMAQNDPDDPEEQGNDIAVLQDEKAANPQAVGTAIALSRRLMQAGRYTEAEQELRQVLQQAPDHPAARLQLGSALAAQGKKDKAIQEWRTLAETKDPTWSSIAQGSISRMTHPEEPDVAVAEMPVSDIKPARPIITMD